MKIKESVRYSLAAMIILTAATQCTKPAVSDMPGCIQDKINTLRMAPVRNPPASIWQYEYDGQRVFYIPAYCCDSPSQLFDSHCNLLCNPDGGFTGKGDGKCADFSATRKNEKLIWQDERK